VAEGPSVTGKDLLVIREVCSHQIHLVLDMV
jgi:hypothetical protein